MNHDHQNPILTRVYKNGKIQNYHLDRHAIVYVRQSTMQQVERHQESTRLQYGLVTKATHLGWPSQRVRVIDEDQGLSASSAVGRLGFQRLVAEVGLDHVGIVLGVEMSRLARSNRDWHQLLEICALFRTLIGDLDGVYDPSDYNDRLLLGLKGTMSEAELHILKRRMLEGKKAKARRGELGMQVPMGYFRRPSGEVIKDSDEQAQATIEMVFDLFRRYGTLNAVLRNLVKNSIQMPRRDRGGASKGELKWVRPNRPTLSNMLRNPIYAGAYVYGRRPIDLRKKRPGHPNSGRTVAKPAEWEVLLKDRLPAYITWEQFEKNLRQLESNTIQGAGAPRNGPSLLSGLIICGRCGMRMAIQYSNNGNGLRYNCSRLLVDYGGDFCQSLAGKPLDELTTKLIFEALKPAALEISLKVAENIEAERRQMQNHWEKKLERSRYNVERAFRQYSVVEPENRLVARELEKQWEASLVAEEELKMEYERFLSQQPSILTTKERESIRELAIDIPKIWGAPTTTASERQLIVRQLIERITVTVQGESEKVDVVFRWAGGHETPTTLIRPVGRLEQLSYYNELLDRVVTLKNQKKDLRTIAGILNKEGWRPAKRRNTFNNQMVQSLLSRRGLRGSKKKRPIDTIKKKKDEWTLSGFAYQLGMPQATVYAWIRKGKLKARQTWIGRSCYWLINADKNEISRVQTLRKQPQKWSKHINTFQEIGKIDPAS
ncbi:MAG: recombinase family protein [Deltaproteobacteria bacterium]|nr:MAG: recombinase family protein [Deltaproteobacteria bacterium]